MYQHVLSTTLALGLGLSLFSAQDVKAQGHWNGPQDRYQPRHGQGPQFNQPPHGREQAQGRFERVWYPTVYETRYNWRGRPYQVVTHEGHWDRIFVPPHHHVVRDANGQPRVEPLPRQGHGHGQGHGHDHGHGHQPRPTPPTPTCPTATTPPPTLPPPPPPPPARPNRTRTVLGITFNF